ncbi:PIN-like domain-containing protein [Flavobacterium ustbae]|uniref:PIN-like domain-containing protein n=1 Tax=Flavobacterium ustbae TaxID=2488790 RepID=UPI000F798873|nr:PIN domain-containing protein [Flavobacterium ustbae]
MKILIDTNIFLDFYRSNGTSIHIFSTLIENIDHFIVTDQIIQEFERSREGVIKSVQQRFQIESKLENFSSSYLQNLEEFQKLVEIQKQYVTQQKKVGLSIAEILKDSSKDPIANYFKEFVNESLKQNRMLYTTDEIINKAIKRKNIGNPPTSNKFSIGDEINWEIIIANIHEDIILVGRDNTYTNNLTFLQKDFHKQTGYNVVDLTERISVALEKAGIEITEALIKEEDKVIEDLKHYDEFWKYKVQIE